MSQNVNMKTFEQEYLDLVSSNGWAAAYQRINQETNRFRYTLDEAKKFDNKSLNRYRDVNPFDHTRVVLKRCDNDYINANFVTLERANRRYILTQGPLAFTMGHFWLMIWEQNSKAILMLNKVLEKNEVKCTWYWPEQPGEEYKMTFSDVQLAVTLLSEEDSRYYVTRVLRLEDLESGTHRDITQFHYTTWPDFGVPTSPNAFLRFLKQVRDAGVLDSIDEPTVVHCSAGIGRSGTFCLVDCGLVIVEKEGIENLQIPPLLIEMRRHRMGLIQTPDQLRFSYQAILEGYKRLDPSWNDVEEDDRECIYSTVGDDEAPPPPPPRGESLNKPPARPLPAIPTSESLGNLNLPPRQESSSSDECPPALPARKFSPPTSSDDDDVETVAESAVSTQELRRRHNVELAERVSEMKRKARETERWHALKRSIYKPLTITFGFLLAGIIIYSYVKH